ncbi:MAG: dihydroorotase [Pseudothermotoga sp.]
MRVYNPNTSRWQEFEIETPQNPRGLVACPTFFDMHTHVRLNDQEDYDSLQRAAIKGGYGGVLIQPNTKPSISTKEVLDKHVELAQGKVADFYWTCSLFGELEPDNKKVLCYSNDGIEYDTVDIVDAFRSKKPHLVLDHSQLYEIGGIFYEGTANKFSKRPLCNEAISIYRNVLLGLEYGFERFHIQHVSTKLSLQTIEVLRKHCKVSCEVTPHHLFFSMNDIKNTNFKINPPLARTEDRDSLLEALKTDIIDVLATDHAPHDEKSSDFEKAPYGTSNIEIAFSAFYTALGNFEKTVEKLTVSPRRILGLSSNFDLDNLTLIDLKAEYVVDAKNFVSKGKNCVFDGIKLKGKIIGVKLKGRWVYWDGEFLFDKEESFEDRYR